MKWYRINALELLGEWKEARTELFLEFEDHDGLTVEATGTIRDLSADRFELVWEGGSFFFWMHISRPDDVTFEFADTVESPILQKTYRLRYDRSLTIRRVPGETCILYQVAFPSVIDAPEG